jgi:hypothetical protein
MENKTRKAIDKLMFKNGFLPQNTIQNPTGWIIEYVGQFEEFLVVYNTNWRVVNVL